LNLKTDILTYIKQTEREGEREKKERERRQKREESFKVFWSTTEQTNFFIFNISKGKEEKGMGTDHLFNDRIAKLEFLLEQLEERKHTIRRA
jgi:hypothetical protein